jgi:hypothetical protein
MLKTLLQRVWSRSKTPHTRSTATLVAAALTMAVLGPLTAIAVGRAHSSTKGTTTVETVCTPVTKTVTATTTTPTTTTTTTAPSSAVTFSASSPTTATATVTVPLNPPVQLSASDSAGNTVSYAAIGLPNGLGIDPQTGAINGTVSGNATTYDSVVIATATDGSSTSEPLTWDVGGVTDQPVVFSTVSFPNTTPTAESSAIGSTVDVQLSATNTETAAVSYGALNLPAGLVINPATGLISGTVSGNAVSETAATVVATDTNGNSATTVINWTVSPAATTIPTTPTETTTVTTQCTKTTVTIPPPPPYVPPVNTATAPKPTAVPKKNPFAAHAMWIWEMPDTDKGNVAEIISQAKADHIGTLIIKGADGTTSWSQFNKPLVQEIHAAGLQVCDWQYIYGVNPATEAKVGALAKTDGANCLVIDAEVQYQGKYTQAQTYINDLRAKIGKNFAVGLAGLPYIGFHTSFPYSVFLGANGAQYNLPQMYWIDIGTSVPYVFETTYQWNSIYQRPIFPLGQLYGDSEGSPSASSIGEFDTVAADYHATGTSWWDFQSATAAWLSDTNTKAAAPANFIISTNAVTIGKGNVGDPVIWAQEHLYSAGYKIAIDGSFGAATVAAVTSFQVAHKLPVSGKIDGKTWDALLKYKPVTVTWHTKGKTLYATYSAVHSAKKISSRISLRR